MKKPYLIIYNSFESLDDDLKFAEAISSNFISKRLRKNTFAVINDKKFAPKEIFELIEKKSSVNANFIVVKLSRFYGTMNIEGINWLKEQFPELDWFE